MEHKIRMRRSFARTAGILLAALAWAAPFSAAAEPTPGDSPEARIRQIDGIVDSLGEEAAPAVVRFLADRDLSVRSHAVRRLVELGEPAVDPLIAALGDERTRWLASGALINLGDLSVRRTVLALKNPDPAIRRNALFVLRQLDARAAAPSIQNALSDPDPSVQVQAIQTVPQFGGEGALRLVLEKTSSPLPPVREAAVGSLPKFGEEAVPALLSLLDPVRPDDVRIQAIRALGTLGSRKALGRLVQAADDPSPMVRYYACLALGDTGDPSVLPALGTLLADPDPEVRQAASEACARMPRDARPHLARFLAEGPEEQRIAAATAARIARDRELIPSLTDSLHDPSPDVRISAVAALMVMEEPETVEPLVEALRDERIRWIVVMALRRVGDRNLRPLLRRTGEPELDYWKQFVLEGMGDRILPGCLESLEREEDVGTRIATLCSMRQIKDTRAVYPLIRLLPDPKLGYVAGYVLSQMGEIAVEPLLLSLQDESPTARARAASALGEIGLERVVRPLREMLADPDPEVRLAAREAIRRIVREEECPPGPESCPN